MEEIFRQRPFKIRNADEYNLSDILSLFVNPLKGLRTPLDFENSIIKGRMGSGKTMFLRANYAYYLFNIVPRLIEDAPLILPVFIRLSDFQHIDKPSEIYRQLIIKIVEELSSVYLKLQDSKQMANIHHGMKKIPDDIYFESKIKSTANQLLKLGSEEYVEKLSNEFGFDGKSKYSFFELSANYKKSQVIELKQKQNPGIGDIVAIYDLLLRDSNGKILLLIDEAGSLDKNFFKSTENDSFFEIFMNQLRTADFIRTKIAVYPNSYSDILTETRYGDAVPLEEEIKNIVSYKKFRAKVEAIIFNYLNIETSNNQEPYLNPEDVFDINKTGAGDAIEQIINGSGGNYRRLIQLLDLSMNEAFIRARGKDKVVIDDAIQALNSHCGNLLSSFNPIEIEFIQNIAKACKNRNTYRFKYPNNSQALYKYMTKSQEFNILNVIEAGSGQRSTTYSFDYSFCVLQDITTHLICGTEKIDKDRSFVTGDWVTRNVTINAEMIKQSEIIGKIEGEIEFIKEDKGLIRGVNDSQYFFSKEYIIQGDRNKSLYIGKKIIFYPSKLGDSLLATEIEIL